MALTADKVAVDLEVRNAAYLGDLAKSEAAFVNTMSTIEKNADRAGVAANRAFTKTGSALKAIGSGAPAAANAMKSVTTNTGNLAAQLNDIGVQLAGGQSPFLIAIQQGSQINQVIGQQGAAGAVRALAGAFTSLINPVSLATIGIIGLGGIAVQYFASLIAGGADSEEVLKKEAKLVQDIVEKWGDALPALKAYYDERKRRSENIDIEEATKIAIADIFKDAQQTIADARAQFGGLTQDLTGAGVDPEKIYRLQKAFDALEGAVNENKDSSKELKAVQELLGELSTETSIPVIGEMVSALGKLATGFADAAAKAKELSEQQKAVVDTSNTVQLLNESATGSGRGVDRERARDAVRRISDASKVEDVIGGATAAMIKQFEGFIAKAAYDVNAYRVGFGSDTVTLSDGSIKAVTASTTTTLADANRDLARRIVEFQNGVKRDVGEDRFNSFTELQKAALTSVAYNYGSLGKGGANIADTVKTGTIAEIAAAIAKLSANPQRRAIEAEAFGGNQFDATPAQPKKTPADLFKGSTEEIQRRIELINAEVAAQSQLNPLVEDYGFTVEKAKIKQQLLNDAKKAGLTITPELAISIDKLAESYARAQATQAKFTDAQKNTAAAFKEVQEEAIAAAEAQEEARKAAEEAAAAFAKDVLGGFIRDLRSGKSAAEALANALDKIADKLLDVALDALFSSGKGGGGLGGLLGGLFGGLFKERGGPVTKGQPYIVGEKRPEIFVPGTNGRIIPHVPNSVTPSKAGIGGVGGDIRAHVTMAVENGALVPTMVQVSGFVAGQQIQNAQKAVPGRIAAQQVRGI